MNKICEDILRIKEYYFSPNNTNYPENIYTSIVLINDECFRYIVRAISENYSSFVSIFFRNATKEEQEEIFNLAFKLAKLRVFE